MKQPEFAVDAIVIGDAAIELSKFPDKSIDLTVTSPPYDNLRTYNGYHFGFEAIARQLYRVTKQGGVVVWVVGDATIDGSETGTSFRQALFFKECGFNLHDTMIYQKTNPQNPSKNRYHQLFEYMFVFSIGTPKTFNPIKDHKVKWHQSFGNKSFRGANGEMKQTGKKITCDEYGMRGNVWVMKTAAQENPCQSNDHPAKFPQSLVIDHILSWSNPGDIVLDPMCGSGTTLKQAKELGRHWIGIDISEQYVNEIALPRVMGARVPLTGLL